MIRVQIYVSQCRFSTDLANYTLDNEITINAKKRNIVGGIGYGLLVY